MNLIIEILIITFLIIVQSIFGVGLLLFGTPSFLLLGYDFANSIICEICTELNRSSITLPSISVLFLNNLNN